MVCTKVSRQISKPDANSWGTLVSNSQATIMRQIAWYGLWNFTGWQLKFYRFLHSIELPQRVFRYFIGHLVSVFTYWAFPVFKANFQSKKLTWSFWKLCLVEYQIRRRISTNLIFNFIHIPQTFFKYKYAQILMPLTIHYIIRNHKII